MQTQDETREATRVKLAPGDAAHTATLYDNGAVALETDGFGIALSPDEVKALLLALVRRLGGGTVSGEITVSGARAILRAAPLSGVSWEDAARVVVLIDALDVMVREADTLYAAAQGLNESRSRGNSVDLWRYIGKICDLMSARFSLTGASDD